MISSHPISEFEELLTVIVPAEIATNGAEYDSDEIYAAYSAFQQFILDSLPFELSEQEIESLLFSPPPEYAVGPKFSISEAFAEIEEILSRLGIQESGQYGSLPILNMYGSMTVAQLMKSFERYDIDSLPYEKRNEVLQASFIFRSDIVLDALHFAERIASIYQEKEHGCQSIPVRFEGVHLSEQQVRTICNNLIEKHLIEPTTDEDNFVYFFTGIGDVPYRRLRWIGKNNTLLTIFLKEMSTDTRIWQKASRIFETRRKDGGYAPAKANVLRETYRNALEKEVYLSNVREIKAIIG